MVARSNGIGRVGESALGENADTGSEEERGIIIVDGDEETMVAEHNDFVRK